MQIGELVRELEKFAPLTYQESYDNAGLIIGNKNQETSAAIVCLDVTEDVIDEAIERKANLVIAHHPIVFSGLKRINGNSYIERIVLKAIKSDMAIYAAHTNLDSVRTGVSYKMAEKIGLSNIKVLQPMSGKLNKLVTYVPTVHADDLREALFKAGAGVIGRYDSCSYNVEGKGTFRGGEGSNPYVGEKGKLHYEDETRVETIVPEHAVRQVTDTLLKVHPYEEVAFDIFPIKNTTRQFGFGAIGELKEGAEEQAFLETLKEVFGAQGIRYTKLLGKKITKVALCGGSGSFLLKDAMQQHADIFITGDFKYHQFFDAEDKIVIADIGHYESEQFTLEIIYDLLIKKFPKFAVHLTKLNTNPVNYL